MSDPPLSLIELFGLLRESVTHDPSWPDGDWPVHGSFAPPAYEIVIGAVLTQNTRWENVEGALQQMVSLDLTTLERVTHAPVEELQAAIASAGFFRRKAATLKALTRAVRPFFEDGQPLSRECLLAVSGVGPETADSILLYAFGEPEFVIDAYTVRLLSRLGLCEGDARHRVLKARFEEVLPRDVAVYREFHALIVQHCKRTCQVRPKCSLCPLAPRCEFCKV